jgi:putative two-component system response regulator
MPDVTIDPRGVRVLLIDADAARRAALATGLRTAGYPNVSELDSPGGCSALGGIAPDLVMMDLDAPGVTSHTLETVRSAFAPTAPPIVGLTSDTTPEGRARAASFGVQDVATRPLLGDELRLRTDNALASGRLRRLLSDRSPQLTDVLRDRTAELDTVRESLAALAAMADYHDDDSNQHAQRVGVVAAAVGEALGLPESFVRMIRDAAPLHDIGKVGISRRILLKPGKLTLPEWMHMQQHVDIGWQILAPARSPVLRLAGEIARSHHEHWDGSGYTAGLVGEEIPISGRIVAIADVWDTLTHDRPYRQAWQPDRALAEIRAEAGAHFDPDVVAAFCSLDLKALTPSDAGPLAA